jgi:threonine synthase
MLLTESFLLGYIFIMKFISTRGKTSSVSFSEAVATGLAPDGGLYLPESLPDIRCYLEHWERLSYERLCLAFFRLFATDIDELLLEKLINSSYERFDHPEIAPLKQLNENLFVLELFHGPTLSFKDIALQLLGNLYGEQIRRTGQGLTILGATSGDTGAAAINALLDKKGVHIFILYPDGGISALQERQMTCTGAVNVFPLAIQGAFDDAQYVLKKVFEDKVFKQKYHLSAVNSINLARILAQCVYYFYAWFRLPKEKRNSVEFIVPTGNFGNILAGWLAQKMGLPIKTFCIATNQNDILYRLFKTGKYAVGKVKPSLAPSMDIQVASNFERFLYYAQTCNSKNVTQIMETFKQTGSYDFKHFDPDTFTASHSTDQEIPAIIKNIYKEFNYLIDPHTACGFKQINSEKVQIVLATAHPAKFPDTIIQATGQHPQHHLLNQLKKRNPIRYCIAADKRAIQDFIANALL